MEDGIKIEYVEGIFTVKLEVRSIAPGDEFEQETVKRFLDYCNSLFNTPRFIKDKAEEVNIV